jgi:hypothetical protein
VTDMLTDQVIAEVDHEHTFAVCLEPHQGRSLLTDPAPPQDGQNSAEAAQLDQSASAVHG